MKYYDGFGTDVTLYVQELERKATLLDAQNKIVIEPTMGNLEPKIELVEPKVVEETVEKKPSRRKKLAES